MANPYLISFMDMESLNSLAFEAFRLLKHHGKTITAAESLTAGLFQASIADFSGASQVFKGGICYLQH